MSEFMHKTEIVTLKQSNADLSNVIAKLKTELLELNGEIERLRQENPDDIKDLKEKVTQYKQREADLKECVFFICKGAKNNGNKQEVIKQLLSALQVEDADIVAAAIEQHDKKSGAPKIIIAFLFGALASLVAWFITNYLEKG